MDAFMGTVLAVGFNYPPRDWLNTGSGTPRTVSVVSSATISNMQPCLGLNYIICQAGIFPSRN